MNSKAPTCQECGKLASLVTGEVVYPHRADLHKLNFYLCECGAYCGCHKGTTTPLGTPAGEELRQLRRKVHSRFDPLWRPDNKKRSALYAQLTRCFRKSAHIGSFSREECYIVLDLLDRGQLK